MSRNGSDSRIQINEAVHEHVIVSVGSRSDNGKEFHSSAGTGSEAAWSKSAKG